MGSASYVHEEDLCPSAEDRHDHTTRSNVERMYQLGVVPFEHNGITSSRSSSSHRPDLPRPSSVEASRMPSCFTHPFKEFTLCCIRPC
jgi:hypothetical protein